MKQYRQPIKNGTELWIGNNKYRIIEFLSERGGSCLVYLAISLPSEYPLQCTSQSVNDYASSKVVIKEFYPLDHILAKHISRGINSELIVSESSSEKFKYEKMKFCSGVARQIAISYVDVSNETLGYPDAYTDVNGTAYSILKLGDGTILKNTDRTLLSVIDIVQIMISICNVLSNLHIRGQLYLDLKPSNIFLFEKQADKSRRIALFDFDTVYEKKNLPDERVFSEGWAPSEQYSWRVEEITEATDAYSMGMVFYWLLLGEMPLEDISNCIYHNDYIFMEKIINLLRNEEAVKIVKEIFASTLSIVPDWREKNFGRFIIMFRDLRDELRCDLSIYDDFEDTPNEPLYCNGKQHNAAGITDLYNENRIKAIMNIRYLEMNRGKRNE